MAATAQGALVGVVTEAGPHECRIRLITDSGSAVACRVSRTRELCILQGTGGGNCRVDWLGRESTAARGDLLVTTQIGAAPVGEARIPDSVPAATALNAERDKMRPLFLSVEAAPRANLDRLEEVEILVAQ
jgi:rod shape-determining protein MreC